MWLVSQAHEGFLDVCVAVIEESTFSNPDGNIIVPLKNVLKVAIECLYACESASPLTWTAMEKLLNVLPSPPSADHSEDDQQGLPSLIHPSPISLIDIIFLDYVDGDTNALFSEIDLLEERLGVMKILSSYGVNKPLYMLRDRWTKSNPDEVKEIISRVCQSGMAISAHISQCATTP